MTDAINISKCRFIRRTVIELVKSMNTKVGRVACPSQRIQSPISIYIALQILNVASVTAKQCCLLLQSGPSTLGFLLMFSRHLPSIFCYFDIISSFSYMLITVG